MSPRGSSGAFLFLGGRMTLAKLMTVDDVADYLNKPRSWVYGNWKAEQIPFRKVGQSLRCRPVDLEKWLDDQN
ncbi:helix-turn-helix domain-containing protein [Streptomyces sp. IMTB 2501]|uniref:helix-turn-helix domain-containing protein n=1 Tax=Streptomyces sp. IMTB 2501 TaxID=1776340 RepID=UPI00273E5049|nr:helix-turn-helix domain-containing protein [Streptomyces sp. IMTB 2501]